MFEAESSFTCPYCGEENTLQVDLTAGENQQYVNDCEVCCHPVLLTIEIEDEVPSVTARKE